jgi:acyl-CoA synthetase (AMP-forming)/AMP-acid ligase II
VPAADLDDPTLGELTSRRAREAPHHPYLEHARSARTVSYAGLDAAIASWRTAFDELGLVPGSSVIVAEEDPLGFAVAFIAAISCGMTAIPINPELPEGEPSRTAGLIGGPVLVVGEHDWDDHDWDNRDWAVSKVDPATGMPLGVTSAPAGFGEPRPVDTVTEGRAVLFTSGSTGTPKGTSLTETQLLFVARQVARNNELTPADRGFNSLPLFHVNAEVVGLLATLVAGATLVLDSRFHRTGFWDLLDEREITWLNAVPAMLAVLTREGVPDVPKRLRFIRSASAPLPDAVRAALGDIPLVVSWGMTEGASQIAATAPGDDSHPGSVGRSLGSEIQARSTEGGQLAAGETGTLWIRGPGIVREYLFGRAAERFDADGWLDTGDLGFVDADGYVTLVGRVDDVINRGGEKVYPAEVEEVLLGDPRVLEAVVVARHDDVLGSVPVAYVIPVAGLADDGKSLVSDLVARCEVALPRFKRPVHISIATELPRAAAGKVQRSKVRQLADQEAV